MVSWLHDPGWRRQVVGSGNLQEATPGLPTPGLRLINKATTAHTYSNAQVDDYAGLFRRAFPWQPPVTLTVRARFSHPAGELLGTAGFGFWNAPFAAGSGQWPTLPRAIWFFYASPPANLALARNIAGNGWKAATLDAWRMPFLFLAPTAPLAMPLMRIRPLYQLLWPLAQRAIGVQEALLPTTLTEWHTYTLVWGRSAARFLVNDEVVLQCAISPRGPLGLVIWKDNQTMTITPWGSFRHGLVACDQEQWMEVERVEILNGE